MKPGNVPTAVVGPVIASLVNERWPEWRRIDDEAGGYTILAEKIGCHPDAIDSIVRQTHEGADFDLVDRILCGLGRWDMWHGVLADVYPTKFYSTCELPGCDKRFPEHQRGVGAPVKRFCCRSHTNQGYGVRAGRRPGQRYRQKNRCNKGHPLTSDNVILRTRSDRDEVMRNCKICERENSRERQKRYRVRRKAALAA